MDNINKIIKTYRNREDIEKYAHVASLEEIKENDYNLNIPRYVDTFEEEEVIPLPELGKELRDIDAQIKESTNNLLSMLNELQGTTDVAQTELQQFIDLLK